ncbi:SEC-C domain-containing protein [Rhodococcus sp. NPDC058505]|uniref:SEC-C domain-containing protein n=1 Tax=Rhodococcus sp. NPDC058505 TaxID=3346531 RepID=UPI00366619D0
MTDQADPIADAVLDLLRASGPLTVDELADLLEEEGLGDWDELWDDIYNLDHAAVGYLPGERYVAIDSLFAGRVLTHRLSESEIASGILAANPDLTSMTLILDGGPADSDFRTVIAPFDRTLFAARGVDVDLFGDQEGLLVPVEALSGCQPGDLVALTIVDGAPRLQSVDGDPAPPPDLDALLAAVVPDGRMDQLGSVIWQLLSAHPTLFRSPTLPLGELLATTGYDVDGDYIAVAGFDFAAARRQTSEGLLARAFGLDGSGEDGDRIDGDANTTDPSPGVSAFLDLARAGERDATSGGDYAAGVLADLADSLAELVDPAVATSAVYDAIHDLGLSPEALRRAGIALRDRGPRRAAVAAHWIIGRAAEFGGDSVEAERHYERATMIDPEWGPALEDLIELASDRGDAVRALAMIHRTDAMLDDPLHDLLHDFEPVEHPGLGRNDKCWCGSGRKYKVCHLGRTDFPLDLRARWLYEKAVAFAFGMEWGALLIGLASSRTRSAEPAALFEAMHDPLVVDVGLVEGGLLEQFLRRRGALLPADELLLAQQWLATPRSVYEVDEVRVGKGMTLRDLRTGDRVDVEERLCSTQVKTGHLIVARAVSTGIGMQIFGGIEPITLAQRGRAIDLVGREDTDPDELMMLLSERFEPVRVVTGEGTAMVACSATVELADTTLVRRKLSRRFGAADGDSWTWLDGTRVLGTLSLDTTVEPWRLTVETMSEERFEELLDRVQDVDPGMTVVDDTRTPAADLVAGPRPALPPAPDDPETAAMLDEFVRGYETRWLDDAIPALDGVTPRQAATDPTRRDDLIRLLASFPQEERPGAMSVRRLREALGL